MHGKSQKCQTKNGSRDYKIEGKLQLGNNWFLWEQIGEKRTNHSVCLHYDSLLDL